MPKIGVVIAAGGKGRRVGGRVPKQFLLLDGKTILQRTVEVFGACRSVEEIVVTSPQSYIRRAEELLAGIACDKLISVVPGGRERQDSVWNGLHAFFAQPDIVIVHDAVRPFVDRRIVDKVIASATRYGSAVVGVKVRDTVKTEGKKGFYTKTLDRNKLWAVQTPQGFRYHILLKAHKKARKSGFRGTDDASVVEQLGLPVRIVEGDAMNIKITTPQDLRLSEMWLKEEGNRHSKR